jgi:hypothetical protein
MKTQHCHGLWGRRKEGRAGVLEELFGRGYARLLWIGITVTFFVLSIACVRFCERLK